MKYYIETLEEMKRLVKIMMDTGVKDDDMKMENFSDICDIYDKISIAIHNLTKKK